MNAKTLLVTEMRRVKTQKEVMNAFVTLVSPGMENLVKV